MKQNWRNVAQGMSVSLMLTAAWLAFPMRDPCEMMRRVTDWYWLFGCDW